MAQLGCHQYCQSAGGYGGGAGPSGAAAVSYESHGEQLIALANNRAVWAFKAGGMIGPRPAPVPPPTTREWGGRVADTRAIELGNVLTFNIAAANRKIDWQNDYDVNPSRAHVKAGASVTWTNTSGNNHTVTGGTPEQPSNKFNRALEPKATFTVKFDDAGTFAYFCSIHMTMRGTVVVR